MIAVRSISKALVATILIVSPVAAQTELKQAVVDDDGVYHLPAFSVPPSDLASEEAKRVLIQSQKEAKRVRAAGSPSISWDFSTIEGMSKVRHAADSAAKQMAEEILRIFPVSVTPEIIGGVQTDVIIPKAGTSVKNRDRVLINLHGGGMVLGARYGGQIESIPIAGLGGIKVITVDYRMAPEYRFPAASEDVAKVYKELLKRYSAKNIGIYGCKFGRLVPGTRFAYTGGD